MKPTTIAGVEPATPSRRALLALVAVLALLLAACGSGDDAEDQTSAEESGAADDSGSEPDEGGDEVASEGEMADDAGAEEDEMTGVAAFPVEIDTATGVITVAQRPEAIVSLSPTATEMLFAIGAGDRVVAVDLFSNYPAEVPGGTLDGFSPDLEAILATGPDLVVSQGLTPDIEDGLSAAGVAVLTQPPASSFDDTYDQIGELGLATGNLDEAAEANATLRADINAVLGSLPTLETPVRVFHEIDDSFYTASSNTFIGQVYAEMGFENIADPLDADASGYPLVDGESIIAADPTLIVFTDQAPYGADEIAARPGWDGLTAVSQGNVVQVDADIASRWGPRIVEFMEAIAATISVDA